MFEKKTVLRPKYSLRKTTPVMYLTEMCTTYKAAMISEVIAPSDHPTSE